MEFIKVAFLAHNQNKKKKKYWQKTYHMVL